MAWTGMRRAGTGGDAASALRWWLAVAAFVSLSATGVELAFERHWESPAQLIPWVIIGGSVTALAMVVRTPDARTIRVARAVFVVAMVATAYGVFRHVAANSAMGPLADPDHWLARSSLSRLWMAFTKGVGSAPTLAPALLAQATLLASCVTIGHPALEDAEPAAASEAELDPAG